MLVSALFRNWLFLSVILFLFAFRADTMKNDVITGEVKSMGIPDPAFEAADKIHVHIEDAPAYFTFYMTVVATDMVVTVGAPWNLKPADFAHFR